MKTNRTRNFALLFALAIISSAPLAAQSAPKVTTPKEFFGFNIADDYQMVNYEKAEAYWKKLAAESDRMKMVDMGPTEEGRHQWMVIISSPANIKNLDHYKDISQKLARAENLTDDQAHTLAREGKAVVWIDGGLHASESVGFEQLVEMIYEMVSMSDPETMRLLNDDITLLVPANPDGSELVADWYMREPEPMKRSGNNLPRLYNKYIGHDDNRDSYMSNMKETANMNRQLFIEWMPQIMYNHHQTGPTGAVIFMPPFRDPFNYNFDPLVPLGIEEVGTAMHYRLVERGMGGSAMRSGSNYSTWWDGGLRTTVYFHNMIGILTEIIGAPTPIDIALAPDKQLPTGDWPLPIAPTTGTTKWHYRQSVDYEMQNNRAILDYASRNREPLLFNIYAMGKRSIKNGGEDHWTISPKRIEALRDAAAEETPGQGAGRGGRGGRGGAQGGDAAAAVMLPGGIGLPTVPSDLYDKVLHDPKFRDPRAFIISADQPDFPTATKFVNALLKNGIEVERATSEFSHEGKTYPAGSFVVKCAQSGRPFVLDMFQPQDHPNDFRYPGGPPIPPYDIAGWTLAYQMGVHFDRIYDNVDGPFARVPLMVQPMPMATVAGATTPAGYLISHQINNSFIVVNRLLKANCDVYWLKNSTQAGGKEMGAGTIWVPASAASTPIVQQGAKELGVAASGVASAPSGEAMKLKPVRIGLYDQYGGNMPAGWLRWILEQYEFQFSMVYPQTLDAGNIKDKFDVIVFTDGSYRVGGGRFGGGGGGRGPQLDPQTVPEQYRGWIGRITADTTIPQIKQFVEAGGSVVTVGSSTSMAAQLGVPIADYLTEMGSDGHEHSLPAEKFYIPGSLMRVTLDNTNPVAYGMPATADVDFDSSPVFRIVPQAGAKANPVAWYAGPQTLDSGWAWGQAYLDGGTAVAESHIGKGSVIVLGPEVTFRGQPHGTFKLIFNGLFSGTTQEINLGGK